MGNMGCWMASLGLVPFWVLRQRRMSFSLFVGEEMYMLVIYREGMLVSCACKCTHTLQRRSDTTCNFVRWAHFLPWDA